MVSFERFQCNWSKAERFSFGGYSLGSFHFFFLHWYTATLPISAKVVTLLTHSILNTFLYALDCVVSRLTQGFLTANRFVCQNPHRSFSFHSHCQKDQYFYHLQMYYLSIKIGVRSFFFHIIYYSIFLFFLSFSFLSLVPDLFICK